MKRHDFFGFMAGKDNDPDWLSFIQSWYNESRKYEGDLAGMRDGQIVMNALYDVRPDLYHFATATTFDPFYVDARLREFGDRIYDEWVRLLVTT